jgi:hypothetical protein
MVARIAPGRSAPAAAPDDNDHGHSLRRPERLPEPLTSWVRRMTEPAAELLDDWEPEGRAFAAAAHTS